MNGKITISRTTSNREPDFIRLRIEDDSSGVNFLDIRMSLENFAKVITGFGYIDCEFELYAQNVGMTSESKTEIVPLKDKYFATDEQRQEALKPFEIDGWKARQSDIKNHHNYSNEGIKVVFTRFV
jgi:hypothetical protein